ncbi:MAG: Asp-tRNA(Asn)/Glu-tRNA(Gln) amidotransferase subunit GatB [Planctomycetota bacterium]
MNYRVVIGMEAHVQLKTASKMFCRCPVQFGAPPNTLVCPVCLGMPGSLPVPNRDAMIMALALAKAMGSKLAELTKFDRKNYYYPDLPKGYQISQYDRPLALGGGLEIVTKDGVKTIRLIRLHIEEDVGKNLHDDATGTSQVDFNRAGTPLVEVVSEPDIASAAEARAYLTGLRTLVQYLGISDGNMQEGNLRCEPNINLHIDTDNGVVKTPITEVKNVNSIRNVERAIHCEVERQLAQFKELGAAIQDLPRSTYGFDDTRDTTFEMRSKEEAHDYRYFPEPDIPPIHVSSPWREEAAAMVPELPWEKRERFVKEHGLKPYHSDALCRSRTTAEYYEHAVQAGAPAKAAANWLLDELLRHANEKRVGVEELGISPGRFAEFVKLVDAQTVARAAAAREVLPRMLESDASAANIVAELGLEQVDDSAQIREAAQKALEQNPKAAAEYREGKDKAIGSLMGFVMRETKGKANPKVVREVLRELIGQ